MRFTEQFKITDRFNFISAPTPSLMTHKLSSMTPKLQVKGNYTPNLLFESLPLTLSKKKTQRPPIFIYMFMGGRLLFLASSALLASGGHSLERVVRDALTHSAPSRCGFIAPSLSSLMRCAAAGYVLQTHTPLSENTFLWTASLLFQISRCASSLRKCLKTGPNIISWAGVCILWWLYD